MWTHSFTLRALANELNEKLRGACFEEIFTYQKNRLVVTTVSRDQNERTLIISVHPQSNYLFLRDRLPRPRKNVVDIFPELVGAHITHIFHGGCDRIVVIEADCALSLGIQLFGTAESNVFLCNDHNIIQKAFKKNRLLEGKTWTIPSKDSRAFDVPDLSAFTSAMLAVNENTTYAALKATVSFLGSTYAREILHRAAVDEKTEPQNLNRATLERIYKTTRDVLAEVQNPKPTVYLRNNEPRVVSVVPLHHLSGAAAETYATVNDAIRNTVFRSQRTQTIETMKQSFIKKLKRERERTQRALAAANAELHENRAAEYERIANIILANLQHLTKGTKAVDLEDIFTERRESIRIIMDPKLTPSLNAEAYFAKAKRARAALMESRARQSDLQNRLSLLDKLLLHLDQCHTREQIEEFVKDNSLILHQWKITAAGKEEERIPFREFVVNGFTVLVGKGDENNDLLTMNYARPDDLWFHVRGAAGSHVVLRVGNAKSHPSKDTVVKTAQIAAYYSKMRTASTVPVAYCQRKYVRKPKGAAPGSMVMDREKVIFVVPALP